MNTIVGAAPFSSGLILKGEIAIRSRVITEQDFLRFVRRPAVLVICGVLACLLAFRCGIRYAQSSVSVTGIVRDVAFVEVAGWSTVCGLPQETLEARGTLW